MQRQQTRYSSTDRRGAAAVEFAIVAPLLILMLMGMIEFGRILIVQQSVTTAAREACREATLPGATTQSATAVASEFAGSVPYNNLNVSFNPTPEDAEAGDIITTDVSVDVSTISKMGELWLGANATISASAAMRKEGFE